MPCNKGTAIDIQSDGWNVYGIEPGTLSKIGLTITECEAEEDATNYSRLFTKIRGTF